MRAKQFLNEDWQKVNKKDKTDGMSDKAVKAYRRENPGSKLKTAVTKKPSELKAGSKDANRRKSFCARMSGMKKAHASAETKRDPDSPINKALRRWNCESIEELEQMLEEAKKDPCWKGYKQIGMKKKGGKQVPNCVPVNEDNIGTSPKRPARPGSRPERGHETKPRYVTDRKTGKQYNPDEEFDKLKNSDDFKAQMKRMATKEAHDDLDQYDTHGLQGYYSDFHKDLHGFRPRHHSEQEWNDSNKLKELIRGLHKYMDALKATPEGRAQLKADGWHFDDETNEGAKVDRMAKHIAKSERDLGHSKDEAEDIAWATLNKRGYLDNKNKKKHVEEHMAQMEQELEEHGKASRELCKSSKPDADLGASMLASCKSQGLRARDGNKSHKLGKTAKSRIKVGGHRIKGNKYGGPLPDWS